MRNMELVLIALGIWMAVGSTGTEIKRCSAQSFPSYKEFHNEVRRSVLWKLALAYAFVAVIFMLGTENRQAAENVAEKAIVYFTITAAIGIVVIGARDRKAFKKNPRPTESEKSELSEVGERDLETRKSCEVKEVAADVKAKLSWYNSVAIIAGILVLRFLADRDEMANALKYPFVFTAINFAGEGVLIVSASAVTMLPFWLIVRNHVRPAKVSLGLFLIFGVVLFTALDLVDKNVIEPLRKAQTTVSQ